MLMTTQDEFADHRVTETLGIVRGNTIRARHVGKDILAALRNLVGGEIGEYTKMLAEAREQAIDRMIADAQSLGADGIVCLRFTTASVHRSPVAIPRLKKPATSVIALSRP